MQKKVDVEAMVVYDHPNLDSITVFWQDFGPRSGQVTIYCYGEAWTSYWGGMPEKTIKSFFQTASAEYLVHNLQGAQFQKHNKNHDKYLERIVNAIKQELAVQSVAT